MFASHPGTKWPVATLLSSGQRRFGILQWGGVPHVPVASSLLLWFVQQLLDFRLVVSELLQKKYALILINWNIVENYHEQGLLPCLDCWSESGLLIWVLSTDAQMSTAAIYDCPSSLPAYGGHGLKNIGLTTVSRGTDHQLIGLMTDYAEQLCVLCLLQELTLQRLSKCWFVLDMSFLLYATCSHKRL